MVLQPSEAGIVTEQLVHCLGLRWDAADWEALGSSIGHFRWGAFLAVLEAKYCCDHQVHPEAVIEAVVEVYDVFIEDIIKKVRFRFIAEHHVSWNTVNLKLLRFHSQTYSFVTFIR